MKRSDFNFNNEGKSYEVSSVSINAQLADNEEIVGYFSNIEEAIKECKSCISHLTNQEKAKGFSYEVQEILEKDVVFDEDDELVEYCGNEIVYTTDKKLFKYVVVNVNTNDQEDILLTTVDLDSAIDRADTEYMRMCDYDKKNNSVEVREYQKDGYNVLYWADTIICPNLANNIKDAIIFDIVINIDPEDIQAYYDDRMTDKILDILKEKKCSSIDGSYFGIPEKTMQKYLDRYFRDIVGDCI